MKRSSAKERASQTEVVERQQCGTFLSLSHNLVTKPPTSAHPVVFTSGLNSFIVRKKINTCSGPQREVAASGFVYDLNQTQIHSLVLFQLNLREFRTPCWLPGSQKNIRLRLPLSLFCIYSALTHAACNSKVTKGGGTADSASLSPRPL